MTTIARQRPHAVRAALTIVLTLVLAATTAATGKPKKLKAPRPDTLRCFDPSLMDLIQQGLARSMTLQTLTEHLEQAGVIVFISYNHQLPAMTAGRTRLIAATAGWRYLSTELGDHYGRVDLLSLLAHELQHAVEIADAPDVVDEASLIALYRRIGADTGRGALEGSLWFETQGAIEIGRRVSSELAGRW
jgi:hypothetical protein